MEYYSTIKNKALVLTKSALRKESETHVNSSFILSFICLFSHSYHSIMHLYFTKIQTTEITFQKWNLDNF